MRKSRLSRAKQLRLMEYFVSGTTARTAAALVGVNKSTAAYYFHRLREVIDQAIQREMPLMCELDFDESFFRDRRDENRKDVTKGKIPMFGIIKGEDWVYTKIIQEKNVKKMFGVMPERIIPDSIVYTDAYRSKKNLDISKFKHYRINHSRQLIKTHAAFNGIENFWNQTKRQLRKFNGVPREHFRLFLKECEWRYNTPDPHKQFLQLKQWVRLS